MHSPRRSAACAATVLLMCGAITPHMIAQSSPTPPTPAPAPAPAPQPAPAANPPTPAPTLKAGDAAPPIQVEAFLKGDPIAGFKPGHVYIVEFWATWCGPCIAAMPHLSALQARHEDHATFIGINIWEDKQYTDATLPKVRAFVAKKPDLMQYTIAYDGAGKAMDTAWMLAAGRTGIPTTFVIDKAGVIAWIGNPGELDPVLDGVLSGSWDIAEGPRDLKAARDAALAACKKYNEGFEAGEAAWAEATRGKAYLATRFADLRYAEMVNGGHYEKAYTLGREMFNAAKARNDPVAMMGVMTPMLDPESKPKVIDRQLAQEVADAVFSLGDPTEANRHIQVFQIHLLLGNKEACAVHRAKAIELIPEAQRPALERWLNRLEADAEQK